MREIHQSPSDQYMFANLVDVASVVVGHQPSVTFLLPVCVHGHQIDPTACVSSGLIGFSTKYLTRSIHTNHHISDLTSFDI